MSDQPTAHIAETDRQDVLLRDARNHLAYGLELLEQLDRAHLCPIFDWCVTLREMRREMAQYDGTSDE